MKIYLKNFLLIVIVFIFAVGAVFAQPTIIDSVSKIQNQQSFIHRLKIKPVLAFDARQSFLKTKQVIIYGLKIGADLTTNMGRFKVGLGYNQMIGNLKTSPFSRNKTLYIPAISDSVKFDVVFLYVCAYAEYILYSSKRWEFSIPLQAGIGYVSYDNGEAIKFPSSKRYALESDYPLVLEPSFSAQFKIFNWLGLGAEAGYRQMLLSSTAFGPLFSGFIYIYKAKIFFGDLYRDVRKPPRAKNLFIY